MRDYNIVIPSATENNIRVCLEALKSKQPGWREKVLVYDNDPSDGVREACKDYGVHRVIGGKPFVFSRAVNACIELSPEKDIIILNDDAVLQTIDGFYSLHSEASKHPEFGIVSSAILGIVGNPEQHHKNSSSIRAVSLHTVAFICVHISHDVIENIGLFDERLIHYGWEDNLYCLQARAARYKLGVFDGCIVEHGSLPSTYRKPISMPNTDLNQRIFESIVREQGLEDYWPVPFKFPN